MFLRSISLKKILRFFREIPKNEQKHFCQQKQKEVKIPTTFPGEPNMTFFLCFDVLKPRSQRTPGTKSRIMECIYAKESYILVEKS